MGCLIGGTVVTTNERGEMKKMRRRQHRQINSVLSYDDFR